MRIKDGATVPIPVRLVPDERWKHVYGGMRFDEESLKDARYLMQADVQTSRAFYEMFGDLGIGLENPEPEPIVQGFGITTIPQLYGSHVVFSSQDAPYAIACNLSREEILDLQPITDFASYYPINHFLDVCDDLRKEYGWSRLLIIPQGYLNTAIKLRGEQLWYDFYDEPELAHHLLSVIFETTDNLRRFVDEVNIAHGYTRVDQIYIPNCAAVNLSPELYRDFILPVDRRLAERTSPNFGFHHCGPHMEWYSKDYASAGPGTYYDIGFGSDVRTCIEDFTIDGLDQIFRGRYSPVNLAYKTPPEIARETREILESSVNSMVVMGMDPATSREQAAAFIRTVQEFFSC